MVVSEVVAVRGVFSMLTWELSGVQVLDGHDAARPRKVVLRPVLVAEGVARDDGRGDEVARVKTWAAAGVRGWIAVVAVLFIGAWRTGSVLEQGRVLVDVGREAVHRCGCRAASRLEVVLGRRTDVAIATFRLGRATMTLRDVARGAAHAGAKVSVEGGRRTPLVAVHAGASVHVGRDGHVRASFRARWW